MEKVKNLIERFQKKYGEPLSLLLDFEKKYGVLEEYGNLQNDGVDLGDKEELPVLVFTDNQQDNRDKLKVLLDDFKNVKTHLNIEKESVMDKLLSKYEIELNKCFVSAGVDGGEKIAERLKKALKKTIIKLYSYEKDWHWIVKYLKENGIRVKNFEKGHKLSDDDLEYLDAALIGTNTQSTNDIEKKYEVIEMLQPIILIGYQEEDEEVCYQCIEGTCKYYIYKR